MVVRVGQRQAALAVGAVEAVTRLDAERLRTAELPPLLSRASADAVQALAELDHDLLVVLQTGRLVSQEVWDACGGMSAGSTGREADP